MRFTKPFSTGELYMSADIPETGQPSRADSKKTHAEELMLRDRLKILGEKHDCDKFTVHRFEQVYSQHLGVFAHRTQFKLLEIGVGGEDKTPGGASLRVWSEAFPNAEIHGVDIYDKSDLVIERCTLHQKQNLYLQC